LKVRETLIGQRVALVNTVRGHAAEFGIIAGKGKGKIGNCSPRLAKPFPA
jgi:transposase